MLIGYRAWLPRLDTNNDAWLESLVSAFVWEGPIVSTGIPKDEIDEEADIIFNGLANDPTLGIHSYNTYGNLIEGWADEDAGGLLIGAIQPFGTVVHAEEGFRSEKAQVLAVVKYVGCDFMAPAGTGRKHCNQLAPLFDGRHFFCKDHAEYLQKIQWKIKIMSGEMIETDEFMRKLSARYGCDLVTASELSTLEEKYV